MATKTNTAKTMKTTKTAKTSTKRAPKKSSRKKTAISHADIAQQAYMLWLERGGSEMENWLEAERQLR